MRGFAAVVAALAVVGCGGSSHQEDPSTLAVPPTAECIPYDTTHQTCTWLDASTQCHFQARIENATGKAILYDVWC